MLLIFSVMITRMMTQLLNFQAKRLTYVFQIMDIILLEKIKGLKFNILHYISHEKIIFNSLLFPLNRYYDQSKGDCLKCSKCCNDDRDVVESECIEKLGSQSRTICSFNVSLHRCNTKVSAIMITSITVLTIMVIGAGIYVLWRCKLRSLTYSRVGPGKS